MDAYQLHEARLLQEKVSYSGIAGLYAAVGPVPAGKVWAILSASYSPDAAETRSVWFTIYSRASFNYAVTRPQSIALSGSIPFPMVTEGMELNLFPGETLRVYRDVATAGSVMALFVRFVESDLPFYAYDEPLKRTVVTARKHGSQYRSTGGISTGGGGGMSPVGHGSSGGGGGGSEPV